MRRNLFVAAVVGIALISTAGIANAQTWYNTPVGLSISLTSEATVAPWDVDVDVTIQTLNNYLAGYTYDALTYANFGSQWWTNYGALAHFVDAPYTGTGPFVFPGNRPALDWDDGATMPTGTVPLIGDGTGAFRGSFSHTFADNLRKDIRAGASSSNLYAGQYNGAPAPVSGSFTDIIANTSVWATNNGASTRYWWFGSAPFTTAPMGIIDDTAAWPANINAVQPIPTISGIGMLVLAGLLAGLGVFVLTRR